MTLMTTEIHPVGGGRHLVVFTADRFITDAAGNKVGEQVKVLRLNARVGVGFAGLAFVESENGRQRMNEWLLDFKCNLRGREQIEDIAASLTEALNRAVPNHWHSEDRSCMHLAGLDEDGRAKFWFVRNFDDHYRLSLGRYECREDFHARDESIHGPGAVMCYRNGDVRVHEATWKALDEALGHLLGTEDFTHLATADDYIRWVKFKMKTIASFYADFAHAPIVGGEIDAFCIQPGD